VLPTPLRKPLPTQPKLGNPPQPGPTVEPNGSKPAQNDRSKLSNLEWASDKPMVQSESMAFQALFDLWNVSHQAGKDIRPCELAESSGLSCLTGHVGLQDLLRLNHPAVLRLEEGQGSSYSVALTAVEGRTATVTVGTQSRTVSLDELEQRWRGEFTLLWRAPPQYTGSLQVGDRGPVVDWLKQNLLKTEGRPEAPSEEGKLFDPSFQEVVKRFQTANGLKSDGIVGPHTIIRLNADVYSGDPHLTRLRKDG
jgi:general secretion pathway protein A